MTTLTAAQVADYAGVSGRTARRWLADGHLTGQLDVDGWTVAQADLDAFLATRPVMSRGDGQMSDLVQHLADLERQLLDVTAAATLWQERCRVLQTQLALDAPQRPSANGTAESTQESSERRNGHSWWRFWARGKPSDG